MGIQPSARSSRSHHMPELHRSYLMTPRHPYKRLERMLCATFVESSSGPANSSLRHLEYWPSRVGK